MLNIQYNILCSISFEHSFYSDAICREMTVMPTSETIEILDSYGLLVKNVSGKTVILQKMDESSPETPFTERIRLRFLVYLENSALYNLFGISGVKQFYLTNVENTIIFRSTLTKNPELSENDKLASDKVDKEIAQSRPFFALIELFLDSTISAGTTYKTVIPNRKFRFQYVFIDVAYQQIKYQPAITVTGQRHPLDSINSNDFGFTPMALNLNAPASKLDNIVAGLKKAQNDAIGFFAIESDVGLTILDNRPSTVSFTADSKDVSLPVPTIENLQIIDNKAVIFFNI